MDYKFLTKEFGLTDKGIHLLRKGYNHATIDYLQIQRAEITRGHELKNWFIIFSLGTILLIVGVFISIPIIEAFKNNDITGGQFRIALLLFIPVVGFYFVYSSLQKGTILKVYYGADKNYRFSLRDILKATDISDFKSYLGQKIGGRLIIGV